MKISKIKADRVLLKAALMDVRITLLTTLEMYDASEYVTEVMGVCFSDLEELEIRIEEEEDLYALEMELLDVLTTGTAEILRIFTPPPVPYVLEEGRSILDAIPPGDTVQCAETPTTRVVDVEDITGIEAINPALSAAVHTAMTSPVEEMVIPEVESSDTGRRGARRRVK